MATRKALAPKTVDGMLKAVLVLARTAERVLESRAVELTIGGTLSPSKVQILRLLGQRGGQMSTQVARFLGVSKPAVTQIINAMIRDRLVTRKTAQGDRRAVTLELSRKGRELHRSVQKRQRHYIRSAVRNSKNGNVDHWLKTLREVADGLARADSAFNHFCAQCGAYEDGSCVLIGGDATCAFLQMEGELSRRADNRRRPRGASGGLRPKT